MEWLGDDVIYGVACALLLMLLIRELLATVAQCVPLSTTLHWLPSSVQHAIFSIEPLCGIAAVQKDVSIQVNESDLSLTSVPRDLEVNTDKVKVECNGNVGDNSSHERCYSDCLSRKVDTLNAELNQCRQLIADLQQTRQNLRHRFGEQLINQFDRHQDGKFENISLDDNNRATSLIRRYDNIYSDERVELLDVLEQSVQGQGHLEQGRTEVSEKSYQQPEELLVSIVVECFENSQHRIEQLMSNLHKQLLELGSQQHSARTTAAAAAADDDDEDDVKSQLKSFDDAVFSVLRQRAAQCDFSACVEAIYERLQFYEHLSFTDSDELRHYITTCAQLAWSLTAQRPSYVLEYQLKGAIFDDGRHQRFHTSEPSSCVVRRVIWPGLIEQSTGFCVSKAVVVT